MTIEPDGPDSGDVDDVIAAYNDVPVILASYAPPPECRVLTVNAAASVVFAADPIGRPLLEALPGLAGRQVFEMIDEAWATQTPVTRASWRVQFDPADPETEYSLDFTVSPIVGEKGAPGRLIGMAVDVTERVGIEAESRAEAAAADLRYAQARDVTQLFQQALLPDSLPVLPDVALAATYLVASDDQAAGGDWLDVLTLPDRRLALVVGDVVGHGAEASVAMGQLRTVLLVHFRRSVDLGDVVELLEAHAEALPRARAATVCVVLFDPTDGALEYVTCGHPAPLVTARNGDARLLARTGGRPLGSNPGTVTPRSDRLGNDELLLLYTDGLVEAPTRSVATGMAELVDTARLAMTRAPTADEESTSRDELFCSTVVEAMGRLHGYADDVTALVAGMRPVPVEPLDRELGTEMEALDEGRGALEAWLSPLGVGADDHMGLVIALVETLTNVIEHSGADRARLEARLELDGRAVIAVTDNGTWQEGSGEGVGLSTVRTLTDTAVVSTGGPTTVEFSRRLTRPFNQQMAARSTRTTVPAPFIAERSRDTDPAVLRVSGDVDVRSAPRLATALNRVTQGSTRTAHLDLSAVTMLSSAGVRVLQPHLDGPPAISVEAPKGSPAHAVLAVIGYEP